MCILVCIFSYVLIQYDYFKTHDRNLREPSVSSTYLIYDAIILRGVLATMDPEHY